MQAQSNADIEQIVEYYNEIQKPIYHTPINLGITKFKNEMKELYPDLKKSMYNKLVKAFKKRSWAEYHGIVRDRGTFPTHNNIVKKTKIKTELSLDYEIGVKKK